MSRKLVFKSDKSQHTRTGIFIAGKRPENKLEKRRKEEADKAAW